MSRIVVRGARQHNLKNVHVEIPRNRFVVITGPSGSGKSSLAFDTVYAEGQRRYVESLSAYARQFLDRLPKPDVDTIDGLSPAICIEQQVVTRNPRSTVGTITEIYDYLRLLFARVGTPHCPQCDAPIGAQTVQQMVDQVLSFPEGERIAILAPVVRNRKGEQRELFDTLRKQGFVRVRVDGETRELGEPFKLEKTKSHNVEVYIDRLTAKSDSRGRLTDSVELALKQSDGLVIVARQDGSELLMSDKFACINCGVSLPEITPRLFSFNSPEGACPECGGLGEVRRFEAALVVPNETLSLEQGAVAPWGKADGPWQRYMLKVLAQVGFDLTVPWRKISKHDRDALLHGGRPKGADAERDFEGILPGLERRAREYERRKREQGGAPERAIEYLEEELGRFASRYPCEACGGSRLRREALAVRIGDKNVRELSALSSEDALRLFEDLTLGTREAAIAERILREITSRLRFLVNVGVGYLSLDRSAGTLSGGESERIRLATQIGSGLSGVLYVLDEPSIGLHPRDTSRLLETLAALRDLGNTLLVVEHDPDTIRAADWVIDMGPAAGRHGGTVVAEGTPEELAGNPDSLTGAFLSGKRAVPIPEERRTPKRFITIRDAREHNLKVDSVRIPTGVFTCVTGVSGSGKSSLVVDTLLPLARLYVDGKRSTTSVRISGLEAIDKVIDVDQSPIGRTPRSNPATYTGIFTELRELFASLPEARARGYKPGRFSFNVKGGRCEACQGDGMVRIEMHFLPDLYVQCDSCGGRRYNRDTLEILYKGLSIADVLELEIDDAYELFHAIPKVRDRLATLRAVGLGYVELGQSATTLSGGESQRIKLARELSKRSTGKTLFVLDEPTTGLHFADVELLLDVLHELVRAGNTVVVIEHHLDVIKTADYVIDLGPEGGTGGGHIVACGTPEEVARVESSHTGHFLRETFARELAPKRRKARDKRV